MDSRNSVAAAVYFCRLILFPTLLFFALASGLRANAQTFVVVSTTQTSFEIRISGAGSWHVEENVNNTWKFLQSGNTSNATIPLTRPNGTYKFRMQSCSPATGDCWDSPIRTIIVAATAVSSSSASSAPPPSSSSVSSTPPASSSSVSSSSAPSGTVPPPVGGTPLPPPGDAGSTTPVGFMTGNFRVDESGAAHYDMPILAAEGVAGVKPQISITYNSQGGPGLLGLGGNISGLSSISRCRQTLIHDGGAKPINWSAEDRFCLNGQRLILVSGTYGAANSEYALEIDNQVRVIAHGGTSGNPEYFTQTTKDGSTTTYGQNQTGIGNNARITGSNGYHVLWAQSRFADSIGNYINYVYEGDRTTGQRIRHIYYAYAYPDYQSLARLEFTYENRTDTHIGYMVGGDAFKNTQRLKTIRSYTRNSVGTSEQLLRRYQFNYTYSSGGVSRLTGAVECVNEASSGCYPATAFTWATAAQGFEQTALSLNPLSGSKVLKQHRFIDVNGDGKQDMVWVRSNGNSRYIEYAVTWKNASNGIHIARQSYTNGNAQLTYTDIDSSIIKDIKIDVIDYNADGRQDLVVCNPSKTDLSRCSSWDLYLSVPAPNGTWQLSSSKITLPFTEKRIQFGDINSDGLLDAYIIGFYQITYYSLRKKSASAIPTQTYYEFSSPQTLALSPANPVTLTGTGCPVILDQTVPADAIMSDYNGDGRLDLAIPYIFTERQSAECTYYPNLGYSDVSQSYLLIYLNEGTQFTYHSGLSFQYSDTGAIKLQMAMDLNNDGLSDLLFRRDYSWSYQLNKGNSFSEPRLITSVAGHTYDMGQISLLDYNSDGYLDMLWHDIQNQRLKYRLWNPASETLANAVTLGAQRSSDRRYSTADITGDGFADLVEMKINDDAVSVFRGYASTRHNKIYQITDGRGQVTAIEYGSLAQSGHYSRLTGFNTTTQYEDCPIANPETWFLCEQPVYTTSSSEFYTRLNNPFPANQDAISRAPVLEMSGAVYVVTKVSGSAPTPANDDNLASITYHYHQAKIQAGGRGYLGFQKIVSRDDPTGVITETEYHQDWPFIGSPKTTVVKSAAGNLLSEAHNTWSSVKLSHANGTSRYRVFLDTTQEKSYSLKNEGNTQGGLLQTLTTDTDYDEYGNVTRLQVVTSGGANTLTKTTVNEYPTDTTLRRLGRLTQTQVTTQRNSEAPIIRTSSFEYHPQSYPWANLLWKEHIEPQTNGTTRLTTTYGYDLAGNKIQTTVTGVANGQMQNRTSRVQYANFRQSNTTFDTFNNTVSHVLNRNGLGQPLNIRGVNGLTTELLYMADGQEYRRRDGTGAWVHTKRFYCDGNSCPYGGRYRVETWVSGGGQTIDYLDKLGRTIRTGKRLFDGNYSHVDTQYNNRGLVVRVSEPYTSAQPEYWTTFEHDLLGRVTRVTAPDDSSTTTVYDGYKTIVTNALLQTRTEERNSLGHLIKVTDNLSGTVTYGYDALGNLTSATTTASGKTVKVRMCYDILGRKIAMHDPDKGGFLGNASATCSTLESQLTQSASTKTAGWWFYRYNDFGELEEQTDAKKQVSKMEYDLLGRMIRRTDYKTNGSVDNLTYWGYDRQYAQPASVPTFDKNQYRLMYVTNCAGCTSTSLGHSSLYSQEFTYDTKAQLEYTYTSLPQGGGDYVARQIYDSIGRVTEQWDVLRGTVKSVSGTKNLYNSYGYLGEVRDLETNALLQKTLAVNARGQVTEEQRGGIITNNYFDPKTGLALTQIASAGGLFPVQDNTYVWDTVGNLTSRHNQSGNLTANGSTSRKNLRESFCYDGLNRLIKSHVNTLTGGCSLAPSAQDVEYDGLGNITRKAGVGTYTYGSNAGPHAVTSTSGDGAYTYDNNGNQIGGGGRVLEYTSYDLPERITKSSQSLEFSYGPDRQRWRRADTLGTQKTVTHYLGNVERIESFTNNVSTGVEWKRYAAGVIYTFKTSPQNVLQSTNQSFTFNDHLGSLDVVANVNGKVTHTASFNAWGQRRSGEVWTGSFMTSSLNLSGFSQSITRRGYTGHEMLDDMGLIHMNGRVYDPRLGRFLQADPHVDGAENTQGYNRYSYVHNNPLNATDPSGFFLKKAWNEIRPFVGAIVAIVLCVYAGCAGAAEMLATGVFSGAIGAAANGGDMLQGAAFGAFSSAVGGGGFWGFVARGTVGGVQSRVNGGKFGHGFWSAGIGGMGGAGGYSVGGFVRAAVLGGTAAEIAGGKFKNGAATAAFSYAMSWTAFKYGPGGEPQDTCSRTRTCTGSENNFTSEEEKAIGLRINELAAKELAESYNSEDEAALALHNNKELRAYLDDLGIEGWAIIDGETFAIKEVSTGFHSSKAIGIYKGSFGTGDYVWHTHPSGQDVHGGDLYSAWNAKAAGIFASGKRLSYMQSNAAGTGGAFSTLDQMKYSRGKYSLPMRLHINNRWVNGWSDETKWSDF